MAKKVPNMNYIQKLTNKQIEKFIETDIMMRYPNAQKVANASEYRKTHKPKPFFKMFQITGIEKNRKCYEVYVQVWVDWVDDSPYANTPHTKLVNFHYTLNDFDCTNNHEINPEKINMNWVKYMDKILDDYNYIPEANEYNQKMYVNPKKEEADVR